MRINFKTVFRSMGVAVMTLGVLAARPIGDPPPDYAAALLELPVAKAPPCGRCSQEGCEPENHSFIGSWWPGGPDRSYDESTHEWSYHHPHSI